MSETIFALATAPGKAGVAVIRISGPEALAALRTFDVSPPAPREARLRTLRGSDGSVLDHALILTFAEGQSFTGEETVELHVHGSIAVQKAVLDHLAETGLARLAEPGEFTKRALLNDRIDMTQVQGLADVIEAETEHQRRAAMEVLGGGLSGLISEWRRDLVRATALLEATIDFADEEVPVDVWPEVAELLRSVCGGMEREIAGYDAARALREGFEVAIIGAPNAGKSSLLNYIARGDVALVSPIPGTTRDVIERAVDVEGLKVTFVDTAGLRETDDPIERMGVDRAKDRADRADLRILLHEEPIVGDAAPLLRDGDLTRRTKCDLTGVVGISTITGEGIPELIVAVGERLLHKAGQAGFVSRTRDHRILRDAAAALRAVDRNGADHLPEMIAETLRRIVRDLEGVVGHVGVEDVLDEIFRSFCLGK